MSAQRCDSYSSRSPGQNDLSGSAPFETLRHKRPLIPKDVPVAHRLKETQHYLDSDQADEMYRGHAEEAKKWIVGPMPVEEFLREFLPEVDGDMPDTKGAFKYVPSDPRSESEICRSLVGDINAASRCPGIKFFETFSLSVESGTGSYEPSCCGYNETELGSIKTKRRMASANLGYAELFFDINTDNDPFEDPQWNEDESERHSFVNIDDEMRYLEMKVLGQNVSCAVEACARQHRVFYFSVLIVKTRARLIRWDRAGAIVSRSFDYKRNPRCLCEFLWRFGLASPEQQGYDPTVIPGSRDDDDIFYKEISSRVAFELNLDPDKDADRLAKEVERHYQSGRVSKLAVHAGETTPYYLVSRPVRSPSSIVGRSTRGYWAVKIDPSGKEHVVAFVKDTWRVDVSRIEVEGEVYDDLINEGVINISGVLHHGEVPSQLDIAVKESMMDEAQVKGVDIQDTLESDESSKVQHVQCTRTDEFVEAEWSCTGGRKMKVKGHVHYRLVLAEVGYPLSELSGTRELFEATRDALKAIIDAHSKCKRLHRDVSVGNIILVRDKKTGRRRGILIDWELSTKTNRQGKAQDCYRSGTWAFMSREACAGEADFRHSVADDMESLVYVLLYCCARFLPHGYVENLGRRMKNFFDLCFDDGHGMTGGLAKGCEIFSGALTEKLKLHFLVAQFLSSAYAFLFSRYSRLQRKMENKWKPDHVLDLWEKTCEGSLCDNDRYVHQVGEGDEKRAPHRAPRTTTDTDKPDGPYELGPRKRSLGDEGEDSVRLSKRRR